MGNPKDKAMQMRLATRRGLLNVRKRRSGAGAMTLQRGGGRSSAPKPVAVPKAIRPTAQPGFMRRVANFFRGKRGG